MCGHSYQSHGYLICNPIGNTSWTHIIFVAVRYPISECACVVRGVKFSSFREWISLDRSVWGCTCPPPLFSRHLTTHWIIFGLLLRTVFESMISILHPTKRATADINS
ncbi:hypothetical protein, unlikely [Trypanosoma brucei gambiense DAL972]|uniref:Uncharacterized protein n=1 Tax=Trypanosoma brucei gambiense (strain MHOM/CI/86/DAL972) TaxID=679716 RepID=C9ZPE1_TRYB9|nr:hypothetical protein, unlikely [Trypanosoma brucei gambiense DAL972]CBH11269.1 hypothetical protein, unlikely [Trypanosoma brucei gambiense DAL972]|eukprot:XP_011773556.1 hypothetical protein, unlikely [Trypanosoma brucei gambiense DAL972]